MNQTLTVLTEREAKRRLAEHYAEQRALVRQQASMDPCVHDITFAFCSLCTGQDPFERVIDRTTGEEVDQPVNLIVSTKSSGRNYMNTAKPIIHDNDTWKLSRRYTE